MTRNLLFTVLLFVFCKVIQAQLILIPAGASWKYHDSGLDLGTAWRNASYADGTWPNGNAQLGYGEGDEATVVSFGPNATNKYITTYFRKTVTIANTANLKNYLLRIKRDDGVVIYVNGNEVLRDNMANGIVAYNTLAPTNAPDDGQNFIIKTLPNNIFVNGNNTIAVEMHQNLVTSTDLSFDFELVADSLSPISRGPYLQSATETGISILW
jgi:acid phosphatase type 7